MNTKGNRLAMSRRNFLRTGGVATLAASMGLPSLAARAQDGDFGPSRKVFWVPRQPVAGTFRFESATAISVRWSGGNINTLAIQFTR